MIVGIRGASGRLEPACLCPFAASSLFRPRVRISLHGQVCPGDADASGRAVSGARAGHLWCTTGTGPYPCQPCRTHPASRAYTGRRPPDRDTVLQSRMRACILPSAVGHGRHPPGLPVCDSAIPFTGLRSAAGRNIVFAAARTRLASSQISDRSPSSGLTARTETFFRRSQGDYRD